MNCAIVLVAALLASVAVTVPSDSAPSSNFNSRTEFSDVDRQLVDTRINSAVIAGSLMVLGALGLAASLGLASASPEVPEPTIITVLTSAPVAAPIVSGDVAPSR